MSLQQMYINYDAGGQKPAYLKGWEAEWPNLQNIVFEIIDVKVYKN